MTEWKCLQAPSEGGPLEAVEALVAKLGRGLERLGELLAPARNAVGRALIDIGYKIHSLLCALPRLHPACRRRTEHPEGSCWHPSACCMEPGSQADAQGLCE